jgi:polysaccharide biosynthesis protein PslH
MKGGFKLSPLRILHLTRAYPYRPIFGGDIAYSRGVIESLRSACQLTVLAATNGEHPVGSFGADGVNWVLVPLSHRPRALSFFTGLPNIAWRNATPAYHKELRALLATPLDAVVIDNIASAHVLADVAAWRRAHPRRCLIYLSHEHERTTRAEKYASYVGGLVSTAAMRVDGWKIGHLEDALVRAVDIVSLINPHERALFDAQVGAKSYVTTLPGYEGVRRPKRRIDEETPLRIAVLGGRGPVHKRNILRDWLDACATPMQEAGIELDVIGDIDPEFRDMLASRHPSVTFSGYVDDLDAHLQTVRLGVVPDTVGRGVKVRLTSYIFSRVPMAGVVGAIDGLPLVPERDFAEAPDLASLAQLCIRLARDVDRLNTLQENAFRACDGRFDWRSRGADLVEAVHQHRRRIDATYSALDRGGDPLDDLPRLRRGTA